LKPPTTIVYFAAVIVGLGVADDMSIVAGALFVVGAFLASLTWQTLLAAVGASAGNRLSDRVQAVAIIMGNLVILAFAVVILIT
jgi:arginine exporter protein ArgO